MTYSTTTRKTMTVPKLGWHILARREGHEGQMSNLFIRTDKCPSLWRSFLTAWPTLHQKLQEYCILNSFSTRRSTMYRSPEQQFDPDFCSPTRRQQAFLLRNKLQPNHKIDFYEASHVIGEFVQARRQLSPTGRQEKLLKEQSKWREGMNRGEAFDLIQRIVSEQKNSWWALKRSGPCRRQSYLD